MSGSDAVFGGVWLVFSCIFHMFGLVAYAYLFEHSAFESVNILSAKNRWSTSLVCFHACVSSRVSWVFASMNIIITVVL